MINVEDIAKEFAVNGKIIEISPLGNGHINSTFLVKTSNNSYVLQKINDSIFKDVDLLMNNINEVTSFLRSNGIETLTIIPTTNGKLFAKVDEGYFRVYELIENALTYEEVKDKDMLYNLGKAYGKLHKDLAKFDATKLGEVIPNFHNTKRRYENLLDAIKNAKIKRLHVCLEEIEQINKYEKEYDKVVNLINEGKIRTSVTHNDPKINNVMFDKNSGAIRCIIDLDTIMPGSYLYDVGDALRSLFTGENEDNKDTSTVGVDLEVFKAYISGYLSEMKNVLTETEINLLAFSGFLLTMECGIRFLEDFLREDIYFHTTYPEHNLVRARTQIKLANDIYNSLDELNRIVVSLL